jgi:hypothetical protein
MPFQYLFLCILRILSALVLTMVYMDKVAQVPSQHKRCNPYSSVVVETLFVVVTLFATTTSVVNLVVDTILVVATLSVATLSATTLSALTLVIVL